MINIIWLFMILSGVFMAAWQGKPQVVTDAAFQAAQVAVRYALELIGIMSFWLGVMKVAQEAGLITTLAKLIKPLTGKLFPSIPSDHPALGAILLNISANILGLGNAATPFGLKAMQELQTLNGQSDKASDAMCTFLALNTSCITLLPTTIIGIRLTAGSQNPTEIVGTTVFATTLGMTVAVIADKILRRFSR
ncbi:MAG: nucleoside recognition domain-containing protein [Bacillota bacterium]|uniref:Spore maturation protein n=1 Tax=Thermanaerosceptrum fracticalcis TaxID=1712410 RepID=A0A7G6E0H9_THEFR|nr:nucleoside recognition domain-containing protein [Thermanaerosceptrum fracticalcis]QNB45583.1 spore maturation protein [Thermanaerosceptrum fracticalcis]